MGYWVDSLFIALLGTLVIGFIELFGYGIVRLLG